MQRLLTTLAVVMISAVLAVAEATDNTADRELNISDLKASREAVTSDADLDAQIREHVVNLYDRAIAAMENAALQLDEAAFSEKERTSVDGMIRALQDSLDQAHRVTRTELPANPTAEQAEDALARERSKLAANRSALRDAERLAEDRATARNEISKRLGTLDQELDALGDELRSVARTDKHPVVKRAERFLLLARREAAQAEVAQLRASLALLDERGRLIPLQIDHAQRRVISSEQTVVVLEDQTHQLRRRATATLLAEVRKQCSEASSGVPELEELASQTEILAERLLSDHGVIAETEANAKGMLRTRKNLNDLHRISELTRRKYDAYGHRGSITRWWPEVPEDFPKTGVAEARVLRLEGLVPEIDHQLIVFEEQRSAIHDLAQRTWKELQHVYGDQIDHEIEAAAQSLLSQRRELLDDLVQHYGRFSNQLVEHLTLAKAFNQEMHRVERFLYAHILWSRSVPKPVIPRAGNLKNAFAWLVGRSADRLDDDSAEPDTWFFLPRDAFFAGILLFSFAIRRRIHTRLETLAERVGNRERDRFGWSVKALAYSVLLAAPGPLAILLLSEILGRIDGSTYYASASEALVYIAMTAGILELTRQLFVRHGFTEAHLGWPEGITNPIFRGLMWPQLVSLPILYVALQFMAAGAHLDSSPDLQVYNNSLGRMAFVLATMILGLSILAKLRPERTSQNSPVEKGPFNPKRWAQYAFPAAGIYAYPIILFSAIVPAILAALGFYVTGLLLAYVMLQTLWLAVGLLILGGLLFRWRQTHSEQPATDDEEISDDALIAERQVRQLFRFIMVLVAALGLYSIWSEAIPLLQALKRVQILPHVALIQEQKFSAMSQIPEAASESPAPTGSEQSAAGSSSPLPAVSQPGMEESEPTTLTLWSLFQALIASILTIVLARNLPALLEMVLRRRTRVDPGARIAFSTLLQYATTIIGVTAIFAFLGVTWAKVQWLAAALTFGLGFGLQEIVANFVSGLILLAERPIRVGDVVTVGNLMGRVTRIQIRATTITLYDRSEMIVPNKEFITTKLVNWTLSDSNRRIDIPVRVAYGTDLELVKRTMVEVARQNEKVLEDPSPNVLLLSFGDDAVLLELRFVVEFGQGLSTKDAVQMGIDKAFREKGISFALPQLAVTMPEREIS